jgi:hypothetical protein
MRFAVDVPNFGDFADPRVLADLARRAECMWDDLERAEPMVRRVDHGPPALP